MDVANVFFNIITTNTLSTTVTIFALSLLICYVVQTSKNKLPPGPTGIPIFGNIFQLYNKDVLELFTSYRQKYGDIFSVKMGSYLLIVINGYDAINEVFQRRGYEFSDRPSSFLHKELMRHTGLGSNSGIKWKEQRTFATKLLRHFGVGTKKIETPIQEECEKINEIIRETKGSEFDIRNLMANAASNIIWDILLGVRFEYRDPKFIELSNKIHGLSRLVGSTQNINAFPKMKYFPIDILGVKSFKKKFNEVLNYLDSLVQEHKTSLNTNQPRDAVDFFLNEIEKNVGKDSSFDDQSLLRFLLDLCVGGTETVSITICWAVAYLLHYPDVQQKLYQEIEKIIGSKVPTIADKKKLPYMTAFLEETQRICTVAPFASEHASPKENYLFGYTVPKTAALIPNLHSIAFDPEVFPDPFKFLPERFLDEFGCFKPNVKNIPFFIGPRKCVGEALANAEIFLYMTSLLQHFEFCQGDAGPPILKGSLGITHSIFPYNVKAIPRN